MELRDLDYSTVWPDNFFVGDEEEMSESEAQRSLGKYLEAVLAFFYRLVGWYVSGNIVILQPPYTPIAPDVAAFPVQLSGAARTNIRSWRIGQPNRPAPLVVFEIASDSTWEQDLDQKIVRYAQLGVQEYFAYDPYTPQVWRNQTTRLLGWRYTPNGVEVIPANEQGHLRSEVLDSTLVPEGAMLRLYDPQGNIRLTSEEAERIAREQAEQREQQERIMREQAEQREFQALMARQEAEQQAEAARLAREQAEQQAAQERQAREQAEQELESLREQLRRLQSGDSSK